MIHFTFLNILLIVVLCGFFNFSKIHSIGLKSKLSQQPSLSPEDLQFHELTWKATDNTPNLFQRLKTNVKKAFHKVQAKASGLFQALKKHVNRAYKAIKKSHRGSGDTWQTGISTTTKSTKHSSQEKISKLADADLSPGNTPTKTEPDEKSSQEKSVKTETNAWRLQTNRDYCSLCKNHIACENTEGFGWRCSQDRAIVQMTWDLQEYILMLHNQWRNEIALGNIHGYKSARRMPVMEWSEEFAYLTERNVCRCEYGHDECRATVAFPYAGQNIALRGNTRDYEKTKDAIKNIVNSWFTEYEDADMSYINAFRHHDKGKKIGHFTVMANKRNIRVGCALIHYQADGFKISYFVCNYAYTNILHEAVYTPGKAASGCVTGKHPIYRGLCSTEEQIKPLPGTTKITKINQLH